MKKLLLSFAAICAAVSLNAQTIANNGFENWTSGNANGFSVIPGVFPAPSSTNDITTISGGGTLSTTPLVQISTGASEGTSFARLTSATLSGSMNASVPDGVYGSRIGQTIPTTARPSELTFDYMSAIGPNDSAVVFIEATKWNGSSRTTIGQGLAIYAGNQATWSSETVNILYVNPADPDTITIHFCSSIGEMFNNIGGAAVANPVDGSRFDVDNLAFFTPTPAPNVSNVVASDISNNGNGTDLQVTFDVPSDETDIVSYYAITFKSGDEYVVGLLQNPLTFVQNNGVAITKNGSNQTATFGSADSYYAISGTNVVPAALIAENIAYKVVVYVEGQNGKVDVYNVSNEITLTSPGSASINENTITTSVYPNPANDVLNIVASEEISNVSILGLDGKVVATSTLSSVNVAGLNSGMYIYEVTTTSGKVSRDSFMKK